jgi:DNA-binding NtrC family response regulator
LKRVHPQSFGPSPWGHAMRNINREILHVDDDPQFTRLVRARLKSYGIQTCPLNDARECLDRVTYDSYRIVLLDIDMPYSDGLQLLSEIKQHDGGIQVLMLTGLVTMSSALQSFRLGAEACLFKPMEDFSPLVEAIHRATHKSEAWWTTLEHLAEKLQAGANPLPLANREFADRQSTFSAEQTNA